MSYSTDPAVRGTGQTVKMILFWAFVGIPLLWGVSQTIANATKMFR